MANDNEIVLSGDEVPVLNREQPIGEVWGDDRGIRYCQDGHHYKTDGRYVFTDKSAWERALDKQNQARVNEQLATERANESVIDAKPISLAEVPALFEKNPEVSKKLMGIPMPKLRKMMAKAGGPDVAGESAMKLMIGWLLKYTTVD